MTKVSELTRDSAPSSDDYVLAVDNATAASKKVTMGDLVQVAGLPSQSGNSGKYLTTDGTTPSWGTVAGGGSGDASTNTATSVDGEAVVFSGTGGKTLKRFAATGLVKATSGVIAAATAGTDYYAPGSTDVAVADGGTGGVYSQCCPHQPWGRDWHGCSGLQCQHGANYQQVIRFRSYYFSGAGGGIIG
jgi:hypothetical protein